MSRLARAVIPGILHHVTQRGNGGARIFFGDEDFALYRDLLAEHCGEAEVEVWAWMPNHVHLILVPADTDGLRRALAGVHRRYAGSFTRGAGAPAISGRAGSVHRISAAC
jgi:putative transposase